MRGWRKLKKNTNEGREKEERKTSIVERNEEGRRKGGREGWTRILRWERKEGRRRTRMYQKGKVGKKNEVREEA